MSQAWYETVDEQGETPVSRGLKSGHSPTSELILTMVEESPPPENDPPIHKAAQQARVKEVRELLEQGADINAVDSYGLSLMHWAAITGCIDLAKLLVNRGAEINVREERISDLTPLALAQWLGHDGLAAFLEQHGGLT